MPIELVIFYALAGLAIAASVQVILSPNPVRAVLSLILVFIATAGLWLLLQSEFLAMALILVYVGAVMVLFLFIVMMLDIQDLPLSQRMVPHLSVVLLIVASLLTILVLAVGGTHFGLAIVPGLEAQPAGGSDVKAVGMLLYTEYLLPFECAGVILLTAMISAIALTFRGPRGARKQQNVETQLRATKASRLRIIPLAPRRKQEPNL